MQVGYVIKTDINGNEIWHKNFGSGNGIDTYDVGTSLCLSDDGGYMACGFNSDNQMLLVRTDRNGNL
ncbi:MAG: hypothetical protein KA120_00035 [Candidatus Goldbacteria bacterium]|nr:hypothetical protein [Candidatus Goldiibacteriota bacterium]